MNPYHDDDGRFTSADQAQAAHQQGATAPRTSTQHSAGHRAAIAAGRDPRDQHKPAHEMTPAEAREHLRTHPAPGTPPPPPPITQEVTDLIRHPFTDRGPGRSGPSPQAKTGPPSAPGWRDPPPPGAPGREMTAETVRGRETTRSSHPAGGRYGPGFLSPSTAAQGQAPTVHGLHDGLYNGLQLQLEREADLRADSFTNRARTVPTSPLRDTNRPPRRRGR